MPLVVPALRFFVVFLNVYETFKTLKPPPPSARRGGKPSTRALSQRKRDLKGCLAVWIIWCCYTAYERTFDRAVTIFLPFYSEIKSVFLLFLVLTRAKGAEPLFLHVLRPQLKPYVAVVDPMLDLSRDLGDFFFALLQVPLDYILSSPWFPLSRAGESEEDSGDSESPSSRSNIPIFVNHSVIQPSRVQSTHQGFLRSVSDTQYLSGRPSANNPALSRNFGSRRSASASTTSLPAYSEHPSHDPPQYSRTVSSLNGHQMWHPPISVSPTTGQEVPVSIPHELGTAPEYHSPEWRTYPAFPSAYPPTPLPVSASLPSPINSRSGSDHRIISDHAYPPIPENEQGFDEMLERQLGERPDSEHSSSISNRIPPGVNSSQESFDASRQQDEDTLPDDSMCSSEPGLSEDDFGNSLRTPHRPPEAMPPSGYSSVDSLNGALSAAGNASSLGTRTSSDSLSSESSSLAGRKRSHRAFQGHAQGTPTMPQSRNATLRGRPAPPSVSHDPLQSSSSDNEHESEVAGDDDSNAKSKRRRVLDPMKRRSTVRVVARGVGSARKASLPSRSVIAGRPNTTQGTASTSTGSTTTNNSTIKGRKPTAAPRQAVRSGPQGVTKTASTSSARSGTLRRRPY